MSEQPSVIIHVNGPPLTEQQVAELKERFAAILASPKCARRSQRATLRLLPRKTRVRLWFTSCIDGIGIWLACHGQFCAAEALWCVTRPVTAPRRAR